MLCKHWFSLILGSWEVNLFCSFILFWGVDEVWQREGPAQGQNGVIDQPCQEGVLLVFQLHRGKRGGKRWRAVIQPVWKEKVVSGDWPLQDFERKAGKLNFMQMVKGRKYRNARFYRRVDMVRSAGKWSLVTIAEVGVVCFPYWYFHTHTAEVPFPPFSLYINTYVLVYPRSLSYSLTQLFHCNWRHCPLLLCHSFSRMQVNTPSWLGWIAFENHYVFL